MVETRPRYSEFQSIWVELHKSCISHNATKCIFVRLFLPGKCLHLSNSMSQFVVSENNPYDIIRVVVSDFREPLRSHRLYNCFHRMRIRNMSSNLYSVRVQSVERSAPLISLSEIHKVLFYLHTCCFVFFHIIILLYMVYYWITISDAIT